MIKWVLALCLCLGAVLPAQAQQETNAKTPPITLAQYRSRLAEARATIAQSSNPDETVEIVRRSLSTIESVKLSSSETVEMAPLLGNSSENLSADDALARLDLTLTQLEMSAQDDTAGRLAALTAVLKRPEFAGGATLWERIRRWLEELLSRFLPKTATNPASSPVTDNALRVVGWIIAIGGAIAIIWLLSYWLQGILAGFVSDAQTDPRRAEDDLPATADEARQRAESLARAGDFRHAVRNLYLSALLTLQQHGVISTDRSLTNREILARVSGEHPAKPLLLPVVDTFDDVWYGIQEPDDLTFRSYSTSIDALETAAHRTET